MMLCIKEWCEKDFGQLFISSLVMIFCKIVVRVMNLIYKYSLI